VLQLINATGEDGKVLAFSDSDLRLAESLASQAAIALTNRLLITQLETLFESFINLINMAIDEKSPYTGGHCQRVPALTMMLAEAVNDTTEGPLADFTMTDKDRYELKIAGLLHDCGKVTTPVHVVDKATKLQTIFDRIHLVDTRFEVVKRDARSKPCCKAILAGEDRELDAIGTAGQDAPPAQSDEDREFLRRCQHRWRNHAAGRPGARAPYLAVSLERTRTGRKARSLDFLTSRRARKPHHPRRHADPVRARNHQQPHRGDHQDAGSPALAAST
jgi:hypothetical protein